jgi:rhodanese-related sulfurtransferase
VKELATLPKKSEIVAYCRGPYCVLAVEAVSLLRKKGFRAVRLEDASSTGRRTGSASKRLARSECIDPARLLPLARDAPPPSGRIP